MSDLNGNPEILVDIRRRSLAARDRGGNHSASCMIKVDYIANQRGNWAVALHTFEEAVHEARRLMEDRKPDEPL